MTRTLILRPRAKLDLDDAYAWYKNQQLGLGDELLIEVELTLTAIAEHPLSFIEVEQNVRRALVARFPYGVFFTVDSKQIVVIAVYHAKRDPCGWTSRI